jgi:2,3-dihydroxyphenylpropionate 1,2-dioxygenase
MSARAFLGISHTPLMGLNPVAPEVDRSLQEALAGAAAHVRAFAPELVVIVAPDHYNGFFNELMPAFCIGTEAQAVGDYLSPAGALNVDGAAAVSLATSLMEADFDVAVSRRMRVDHGFSQPLQLLWGGLDTPPVIPVFVNAVAPPGIPRMRRCRSLGEAIGRFLDAHGKRTLLIGSGGLSHEPPVPTLTHPDPAVRERITVRRESTAADFEARKQRVMAAGRALAAGDSAIKPLNPDWDTRWMDALEQGAAALDALSSITEESIASEAGMSAHESKNWLIARSALATDRRLPCPLRHYQAIPEYIAGFGLLMLTDLAR